MSALAAGAVLTAAFAVWETRAREPMLPVGLFADRTFTNGNIAMFLHTGALYSSVFFLAQYLQVSLGYGPLGAACGSSRGRCRCSSSRRSPDACSTGSEAGCCSPSASSCSAPDWAGSRSP